jgi:hypothetical protein
VENEFSQFFLSNLKLSIRDYYSLSSSSFYFFPSRAYSPFASDQSALLLLSVPGREINCKLDYFTDADLSAIPSPKSIDSTRICYFGCLLQAVRLKNEPNKQKYSTNLLAFSCKKPLD